MSCKLLTNQTTLLTNIKTTNGIITFSAKMRSVSTVFVVENTQLGCLSAVSASRGD